MERRFTIDNADLQHLLCRVQDGIVARRQLVGMGASANDIRRMIRRRDLIERHPGVYSAHSGRLDRAQLEWVAVLALWPAALGFESALGIPGRSVQVVVAPGRQLRAPTNVLVRRRSRLDDDIDANAAPPRLRVEAATIDTLARNLGQGDVAGAFTTLSTVLHSRRTSVDRIERALAGRPRVGHRRTIESLLEDARNGACSVLEQGYLHRVERAHGLPPGSRQHRSNATGRATAQDVRYDEFGLVIELDGRAFHDSPRARDNDARRDLAELAMADAPTARVTYGLVFDDACRTAGWVARILCQRGWAGPFVPCPQCPRP